MSRDSVSQFEGNFAAYQGACTARAFWMGRVGLYAVLRALDIHAGSRVGVCSYTCVGVIEAVVRLGATPVFLDVDRHMNIAPESLEGLTSRLQALVLQHTFGVPCDLDRSMEWAQAHGVPIIEDCCHALGARWSGQRVGNAGAAGIFSFQWGKPFSTGQGGMVTFGDAQLAHEVDQVMAHDAVTPSILNAASLSVQRWLFRWLVTAQTRRTLHTAYKWLCRHGVVSGSEPRALFHEVGAGGFLRRLTKSQAAAGVRGLRRWPETMRARCEAAAAIHERCRVNNIAFAEPDARSVPMYLRCPFSVRDKQRVLAEAQRRSLDIAGWYESPAHPLQGHSLDALGYEPNACPGAEAAFRRIVTLPTAPALSQAQLHESLGLIREAL